LEAGQKSLSLQYQTTVLCYVNRQLLEQFV